MRDALDLVLLDVESVTVRAIAGDGDQAELLITTRRGSFTLRLIGRSGRMIRFTDLRSRDRKRQRATRFVSVPFTT